jgi:hypothetical protein
MDVDNPVAIVSLSSLTVEGVFVPAKSTQTYAPMDVMGSARQHGISADMLHGLHGTDAFTNQRVKSTRQWQ